VAYDEGLAQRVREVLANQRDVAERKMFGGLAFLVRGNMCCGVVGEQLMVRVGPAAYDEVLSQPHASEMNFTGRPMKGFVYVEPEGLDSDASLQAWVARATDFVRGLPPK
jgi:TfoX/Sxy family transcriptional regulator of competence genes